MSKISRNDPCWCGSGLKYKYCHLNRSGEAPATTQEIIQAQKKVFGKKYCLHPQASWRLCRGDIVKAHSIQRGRGLSRIARDGYVYGFTPDFPSLRKEKGWATPKRIGIKVASTFTGFCGFHDNSIFEPIEKHPFQAGQQHAFLLAYRALCREIFLKRAVSELIPLARTLDRGKSEIDQVGTQGFVTLWETGIELGLRDGRQYKSSYDRALLNADYSQVWYYIIELDRLPDFLSSTFITPEYDFLGRQLQDLANSDIVMDHLSCSVIATDEGGAVVFSWLGQCPASERFVGSLDQIPDGKSTDAITRFIFEQSENVFVAPAWWDNLSTTAKTKLSQRVMSIEPEPGSLQDDGLQYVSWKVVSRKTNCH